jgi:hypothetical protein
MNALSPAINVSTANKPLTIMEAGSAELIGRALALSKSSNPNALPFVTVISHSSWKAPLPARKVSGMRLKYR